MTPFDKAIEFVLAYEGEISDDPHDSGGLTKWGISERQHPEVRSKEFTRDRAVEIYKAAYWNRCKCGQLPSPIAFALMDCAVNQGPPTAIRLLQKSLSVRADGVIGPQTLQAIQKAKHSVLVAEFCARRAYQYSLHPDITRFGLGWFRRLAACQSAALEPL